MKKQEQNKLAAESIKRAVESIENGIVVEYHDNLNMDAFNVYVRKDGQTVKIDTKYHYKWSNEQKKEVITEDKVEGGLGVASDYIRVLMTTSSSYYGTAGLKDMLKLLEEKYGLPSYFLNIGWYTFPIAYLDSSGFLKYIQDYYPKIELYKCDYEIVKTED